MLRLIITRLVSLAVTLLCVSLAIFLILEVLPGDPAAIMLGTAAREDTLAALRQELGLDQPALLRYLQWIGGILQGDLGQSITYKMPVSTLVAERMNVHAVWAGWCVYTTTFVGNMGKWLTICYQGTRLREPQAARIARRVAQEDRLHWSSRICHALAW